MFHPVKNQAPNKKNNKEDKKPFENRKNVPRRNEDKSNFVLH